MFPIYNPLSPDQVEQIHEAALEVLAKAGLAIDHPKAQEALSAYGGLVSEDRKRVFLPKATVEKLLAKAPREFLCAARKSENDMTMKLGNYYSRQGGGPFSFYDMRTCQARPLTVADTVDSIRLVNHLPHINAPSTMTPSDLEVATYDVATAKLVLENTEKHFWCLTTGAAHLKYELEMAAATVGGVENLRKRPILSSIFCVIAPLRFPADEIDRLILCGQYGVNVMTPLTVLVGGSAPYTLAGCMTQMTAEFLGAVSLCQALCPGLGQWYYTLFQYLDMKTGISLTHSPEIMAMAAAGAQMSAHYGLPSLANTLLSGDCQPHQVLFQYGINILMGLLTGVTFQVGAGSLECGNLYSHHSLILIDEILDYLKAFMLGINITPESLAVEDIIEQKDKGEYLSSKLTIKYLRKEKHHRPELMNCPTLSNWLENPSTILDRAEEKFQKIKAADPRESPISPEAQKELEALMKAAVKALS
ncbi:MAG: trimethylamine methyltransferase family protein [Deltaproteobacteria bacterium]|jgi:trimethylamine--corrinoid protein Co-methyltransferase|nr:trimethylamine methyltransferase family protein [Deltaproteobacteria bacterium]